MPGDIIILHDHIVYDSWNIEHDRQTFVILRHFLPFYSTNKAEIRNFKKMKKTNEDIIILDMCTINDNHMMYGSWDMEHNGQNLLSFCCSIFALLSA